MSRQSTYRFCLSFLLITLVTVCSMQAVAQPGNRLYSSHVLYDTLTANSNKEFLFNSINITNLTSEKISITVNVDAPKGWSSTQKVITLSLNGNENTIVPIRLSAQNTATVGWQTVKLEYHVNNNAVPDADTFRVRLKEFSKFKATLLNSNVVLPAFQKNNSFPVSVKNLGNTPDVFTIAFSNDQLQLQDKISFPLAAGKDSTYTLNIRLTEGQFSVLRKEEIKILVSNQVGETVNLSQNLSKIGYMLRENSTAYLDMPLRLEAGGMYSGNGNLQYYGGIAGYVDLTDNDRVSVDFRSNTYAPGQVIDNRIIRGEYRGEHVVAMAGNLLEVTDFFVDGYGGKVGYKWDDRNKAQVFGMLKSRIGNSQLYGGNFSYGLSKNVTSFSTLTANFENVKQLHSYLAKQGLDIRFGANGKLIATGGVGLDETKGRLAGTSDSRLLGSHFGYDLQWSNKRLGVVSNVSNYSNSFPGIYKGQRLQIHDVRVFHNSSFMGGYYEYTFRKQNYFLDDSLYSDVFNLRTKNYGVRVGHNMKKANFILSAGRQEQEQPTDEPNNPVFQFTYLNLNVSTSPIEGLFFSTNSYIGHGSLANTSGNKVLINSNQASAQYKNAGLTLRYDVGPYYYHEYIAYLKNPEKFQRVILSPYVDANFFNRALSMRAQFNYAKTVPNFNEVSNILTSVQYSNYLRGVDFSVSGIIPVQQRNTQPFINASVRFRLHAPFIAVRKYYDARIILFKDENGNGRQDSGEDAIAGQMLSVNNNLFVTNLDGHAIFKNISAGTYKLDLGYASKVKGWIPVGGTIQQFDIQGNKNIYVPYKAGKTIEGKLTLTVDSNSALSYSLANIRVTATTGEDGSQTYSTITDANGEFHFSLPDGNYLVKLNEGAFDDNFRPTQLAQRVDLINNQDKTLYFEIKQKKRGINIRKK
ncbi:carboxypeptidase-like regulatory domain-containing protein [Polluticoccus soli]|uniref:carboxypeptidase-like regulatory domain-containing protein n=1 Tax=Polluticoccus soli TaxID=3034150 RepID=UPI0023E12662|nr:carboxypeptidase-like regulatory domain-containing protein [Flavipsychrobacter sp. JY13-12]